MLLDLIRRRLPIGPLALRCSSLLLLMMLCVHAGLMGQRPIRRHFFVLYEATLYAKAGVHAELMEERLPDLFAQQNGFEVGPDAYDQARQAREGEAAFDFFDPGQDAISFHHLGLSSQDQAALLQSRATLDPANHGLLLGQYMIRQQVVQDEFAAEGGAREVARDFFKKASKKRPGHWSYPGQHAVAELAPQLLAMNLQTDSHAEEYIVVVVLDANKRASQTKEAALAKLNVLLGDKPGATASHGEALRGRIASIESGMSISAYFHYQSTNRWGGVDAYLQGYRLKPRRPADEGELLLNVEGSAHLTRDVDQEGIYTLRGCGLTFPEVPGLRPSAVWLRLNQRQGAGYGNALFAGTVCTHLGGGKWQSPHTEEDGLMAYADGSYHLPDLALEISPVRNKGVREFELEHLLLADQDVPGMVHPWKLAFGRRQVMGPNQVTYSPVPKWMLPALFLFLTSMVPILLAVTLRRSRPGGLGLVGNSLTETYMSLDNAGLGRQSTPYRVWDASDSAQAGIRMDVAIDRKGGKGSSLLRRKVQVTLTDHQVPQGFEVFLTAGLQDHQEYAKGFTLQLTEQKGGHTVPFYLHIRQQDLSIQLTRPTPIRVSLQFRIPSVLGPLSPAVEHTASFTLHIGPDLGDLWMGFDPGTSGTVTAVGTTAANITVCTDQYGEPIEPSVVSFDRKQTLEPGTPADRVPHYFGTEAYRRLGLPGFVHFQSMKKLLGFKDRKEIGFESGQKVEVTGKELATLLVKGVYSHSRNYLERPAVRASLQARGSATEPTRAVVAIPNNFTLPKIKDMVDCIAAAGKFREIRYIHEAEAVLFYYLSRFGKLCPGEAAPASETVLVFDMGGATINASVVTVRRMHTQGGMENYHVGLDAKIGYGIGGDTIDYCLIRHLLDSADEYPQLKGISFSTHRAALSALALKMKMEIIQNYKANADVLITSFMLSDLIREHLQVTVAIDPYASLYYQDFKKTQDRYPLLFRGLLREIVYDNIMAAVKEVLEVAGKPVVDRVIFSGRSTAFPMVGAGVMWAVNGKDGKAPFLKLGLEESKTAVAMGCCWYGINRKAIHMGSPKTSSSIGVKQTLSADGAKLRYLELVPIGRPYPVEDGVSGMLEGTQPVSSDFALDGGHVSFMQVMGMDAEGILSRNEKHKFSNLIRIPLASRSTLIGARVWDYDLVQCVVRQEDGTLREVHASVADQEIAEANEEHYTWTVN